jgi:hypothetical protein
MAFTEANRVAIRRWLGYPAQRDNSFESAITNVQSVSDGGAMVDSSTETEIKSWLTALDDIRAKIAALRTQAQVAGVGQKEAELDTIRGIFSLATEGRMLIGFIADAVGYRPRRDVFVMSRLEG